MKAWLPLILSLLIPAAILAGTNNLPTETADIVQRTHVNKFKTALSGDLVPRDSSGNVGTNTAGLGTSTYHFTKAFITSGAFSAGDIKAHHSYNGAAPIGDGWMLCDGRQVTQSNYDTEHGAGSWANFIVSSPLLNKYLPNMTSRYLVGKATTTQSGSSAITAVGNTSNTIDLHHSHTYNLGGGQWYKGQSGTSNDQSWDNCTLGGTFVDIAQGTAKNSLSVLVGNSQSLTTTFGAGTFLPLRNATVCGSTSDDYVLGNSSGSTGTSLSSTQSIQPDSIEVQYYMRIID
jgi:hypothetical protein